MPGSVLSVVGGVGSMVDVGAVVDDGGSRVAVGTVVGGIAVGDGDAGATVAAAVAAGDGGDGVAGVAELQLLMIQITHNSGANQ